MGNKFVYLYGFNKSHELVNVKFLMNERITIRNLKSSISKMLDMNSEIIEITAVDKSKGLTEAYWEVCKAREYSKIYEFWDYVTREGFNVYSRV